MSSGASESGPEDEWEYRPVRFPAGISRRTATMQLSINAELSGWELSRSLLYADGTRKVWLRRKRSRAALPGVIM